MSDEEEKQDFRQAIVRAVDEGVVLGDRVDPKAHG